MNGGLVGAGAIWLILHLFQPANSVIIDAVVLLELTSKCCKALLGCVGFRDVKYRQLEFALSLM
jgi:hypothetical protein